MDIENEYSWQKILQIKLLREKNTREEERERGEECTT